MCERVMGSLLRNVEGSLGANLRWMKPESWESLILLALKAAYGS